MEPTRFDLTARRIARLDPNGFFSWLLKKFADTLRFAGWLDPRTSPAETGQEVTGDTVARLEELTAARPPWMFPIEFQTVPDPAMFGRLQQQIGEWWQDLRPDPLPDSRFRVCAAVVNLTGSKESAPASRVYRFPAGGLFWGGKVCERYLASESASGTLRRIELGELRPIILTFIPLMHGAGKAGIIKRWLAATAQETDTRRRADLGALALTLVTLKEWADAWKEALKGWNMQESPFVLELQAAAKLEGKREGELQATLKTTLKAVKVVLQGRFGTLSADLLRRIDAIIDLNQADQMLQAAVQVTRPEELPLP